MNPRLAAFLAAHAKPSTEKTVETKEKEEIPFSKKETFSLSIVLDSDQQDAVDLAKAGKSFCLIGKAGTGKTTSEREIVKALIEKYKGQSHTFRVQGTTTKVDSHAIAVVAFTRVASGNSKKAIIKEESLASFEHNITTLHNFLEFAPEFFWDEEKQKDSMRFLPRRDSQNPLTTAAIIFEESSMIDLALWEKIYDAMQRGTQCIFIGDINQLPPVFGPSILNYALTQLPIVELKTVYRQSFESNVLLNAHNILEGKPLVEAPDFKILEGGPVQKGQHSVMLSLKASLEIWMKDGRYNPETDIILSPFNVKDLGTDNINSHVAEIVNREAVVFEIFAGIRRFYLAVGDKIMYQKQAGIVTAIYSNGLYSGRRPKPASKHMSRFGVMMLDEEIIDEEEGLIQGFDTSLEQLEKKDLEELSRQSSHVVEILLETGETHRLAKTGDLSAASFSLAYALTVHKAQGCEWRKVIIVLHKDHSIMAYNELLYTAVTRASKEVVIVGKKYMIQKAIDTRRIKGSTIEDKIQYFNANLSLEGVLCTKN